VNKGFAFDYVFSCQQLHQLLLVRWQLRTVFGFDQIVIDLADRLDARRKQVEQCLAGIEPVQPCHPVERLPLCRQAVGLLVIDHLQPVFDHPVKFIGLAQQARLVAINPSGLGQGSQRITSRRHPQMGLSAAEYQLVHLGIEFRFPYPSAPALQVIAGPEFLPGRIMVAYLRGDRSDIANRPVIQRPPPDERIDRFKKITPQMPIAGGRTGADIGGLLPRQRARFIIADRRFDRQRHGTDFGRRPQPHVDPENIAVGIAAVECLDQLLADPPRRVARFFAAAHRNPLRIIDEDRVDIRRIVEFAAAMLAQTDDGKALKRCIGIARRINVGQSLVERPVGKIRQPGDDIGQRQMARQITNRQGQRQRPLFPAQFLPDIVRFRSGLRAIVERRIEIFRIRPVPVAPRATSSDRAHCPAPGRARRKARMREAAAMMSCNRL